LVSVTTAIDFEELRTSPTTLLMEGHKYGAGVSFFLIEYPPGRGNRLHRHPYAEVFIVQEGEALFTVGDSEVPGRAGSVVVVPAGDAHRFQATGEGTLRLTCIHAAGEMQTEWL
jgi:mannose-6-phosphate isomerase-like protein (cupin superfamily)